MKIIICDPTEETLLIRFYLLAWKWIVKDTIKEDDLLIEIPNYHGMVVRSRTKVRKPLIDAGTQLRLIVRGGVGLETIDAGYARAKGITVENTPLASSAAVAELTIGYLFALARSIPQATASMKQGRWDKKLFEGEELSGKTLGIIGIGNIGREVVSGGERPVHSTLLAHDVPIGEHLAGLDAIPDRGARFFAVPVKVRAFGTFPVRAFAIV